MDKVKKVKMGGGAVDPVAALVDAGARSFVDRVAPDVLEEHPNGMRIGKVWMRGYYIADLPPGVRLDADRLLRPGADTWVSMFIRPLPPDVAATLCRRQTELVGTEIFDRRRGALGSPRRQAQIEAIAQAREEVEVRGRPIFHLSVYMAVYAASPELLEEVCRRVEDYMRGLRVAFYPARWMQPAVEYALLPAGTDRLRMVRNMTAGALGPLFPFTRRTYYDPQGFPYGVHGDSGTWVILDPFGPEVSNASHLIVGMPGMGKSAYLKRFIELAGVLGHRVIVVDLEGEYRSLVEDLGGAYLSLSRTCPHSINLLEPGVEGEDPFGGVLSALIGFLGLALGRPLAAVERQSIIPYCYHTLLERAGVDIEQRETWRPERPPTLRDLQHLMEEEGGTAAELAQLLYPYTSDNLYGNLFSRPTSVDVGRTPVVGFSLQGVSPDMLAPFMWLVVSLVWREITSAGGGQPVHLVIDEGWYLMRHPDVGMGLADMARRFRKHNAALHLATHFAGDLAGSEHAKAIRGAVGHVILFAQQPDEAEEIGKLFGLSSVEVVRLRVFGKGEALLLWNGGRYRIPLYIPLDPRRRWLFETGAEQMRERVVRQGVQPKTVE